MPNEVWMIWPRDHLVRRIYLADKHSEHVTPSWFGESIGHYENGDTLVVDTVGVSTKISYIDNFRMPHSEKLHLVERFIIEPGGKGMRALVTVEDPDTFSAPLTMTRRRFKSQDHRPRALAVSVHTDGVATDQREHSRARRSARPRSLTQLTASIAVIPLNRVP
jgi:hypothetical protein